MKKKVIYIAILIIILILGYLNYFADDKEIDGSHQVVETTNVTYTNDDYVVEAQKQKDYVSQNETGFEKAKAKVNEMLLSGDNVFIDKVRNLALKNNILGISPNGWKFKAQEADYFKAQDEIKSTTGVVAENEERGIKISGQNFTTNSKMSYIKLEKDVVLENGSIALKGDKGDYDDITKIVNLMDNITLEGRGKEQGLLSGNFKTLKYNMQTKVLTAWEPFDVIYKGIKLSADDLYMKEDDESLKITKNVKLYADGFDISLESIDKAPNSNILNLNGKIEGTNGVYSFVADAGKYNTETKILEVSGNIKASSKDGELLLADKVIYNTVDETIFVLSSDEVNYKSPRGNLVTKSFTYDMKTGEIVTDSSFVFNGPEYESEGKKLYYNNLTKDMKLTQGYIIDKVKKQKVSGNEIFHNRLTRDTIITGNAYMEDTTYALSGDKIDHKGKENMTVIPGNYTVTYLKDGSVFKGQNAEYNGTTYEFSSKGSVVGEGKNYIVYGENLEYNSNTGFGKFNSKVVIENPKDNIKVTGDNFTFQNQKYMELSGNLILETDKFIAKSEKGTYNFKDEKIYIPSEIVLDSKDGKTHGTVKNGEYSTKNSVFYGKSFKGNNDDSNITSNVIKYFSKDEKILFSGNVIMKNPDSTIKDENVEYYPNEEKVKLIGKYIIYYGDFTVNGIDGVFNNTTGLLNGDKTIITSSSGDRFEADKVDGNLKDLVIDFTGNIKGHIVSQGEITDFTGNYARLYFRHGEKYELLRSEIRNNAVVIQKDRTLYSDYIEIDALRKLAYSKDNSKLVIKDKNGTTVVTSDAAEMNMNNDTAVLVGNVRIDNENSEQGTTIITAKKAFIDQKNNTMDLTGNVKIENKESIVEADRGIYNMQTKKINASGNVYVNYKN